MKNIICKFLVFSIVSSLLVGCSIEERNIGINELIELEYEEISDKLIRFHVLANSDSEEDQALKLEVRDAVIDNMYDKLGSSETLEESREILLENSQEIIDIAQEVVIKEGFNYDVDVSLGTVNFPDKVYGDYIFEQGEYEAFEILIGNAEGKNWWCVMFPPLCFVDESKDTVSSNQLEESLAQSYEEKDNNNIMEENIKENEDIETKGDTEIEFRFKIVEFFKGLFN